MEGNVTDSFQRGDNKWCCKTTSEECNLDNEHNLSCIGKSISLQEQCSNYEMSCGVCNHYPHDPFRNLFGFYEEDIVRSFIDICHDNRYYLILYSNLGQGFLKNFFISTKYSFLNRLCTN